jgi:pyruvate/2-oxoglutarate dehydrogenase complex dihydrolipoamide dehydrogenase (E3) component
VAGGGYVLAAGTGFLFVDAAGAVRELAQPAAGRIWQADRIIIAVGGHPGRLPIPGAELALTYTDIRTLTALPGRVAVIGGADTGCQLASILTDLGCQTLLLEYAPRLNPRADQDISAGLGTAFTRRGIDVVTGASAERLARAASRPRTPCWARAAAAPTTSSPPAASPTPNMPVSG